MALKLPPWLDLPNDDYDVKLVYAQMNQRLVEGIGFCGWKEGAVIDPGEITGKDFGDADRAMRERERRVLKRTLGNPME